MDKKIINLRGTIFLDGIIPFSSEIATKIKNILSLNNVSPIILQNLQIGQNPMLPDWGLVGDKNRTFIEVHNNRIDFFAYEGSEQEFCTKLSSQISNLSSELHLRIKRLAFSPTYQLVFSESDNIFSNFLITPNFQKTELKDFSMNRVYTRSETIEGIPFTLNYNSAIALQALPLGIINPQKILLIINDINTKADVLKVYTEKEINLFFNNISCFNLNLLSLILEKSNG